MVMSTGNHPLSDSCSDCRLSRRRAVMRDAKHVESLMGVGRIALMRRSLPPERLRKKWLFRDADCGKTESSDFNSLAGAA